MAKLHLADKEALDQSSHDLEDLRSVLVAIAKALNTYSDSISLTQKILHFSPCSNRGWQMFINAKFIYNILSDNDDSISWLGMCNKHEYVFRGVKKCVAILSSDTVIGL